MADSPGVPRMAMGCAFVALGAIAVIAWLATVVSLSSGPLLIPWLAVAIGTTLLAYLLSRRLWPGASSAAIPTGSEAPTGTDRNSWRKPGRWHLTYAALWLAAVVLYFLAFGTVMALQDVPLVLVLCLFPAVGFLLIRSRGGLWVVALLGLPIAGFLLLVAGMSDYGVSLSPVSQAAQLGLVVTLVAALLASLIGVVVLPRPKWVDEVIGGLGGF